jgi:hypothetical protein
MPKAISPVHENDWKQCAVWVEAFRPSSALLPVGPLKSNVGRDVLVGPRLERKLASVGIVTRLRHVSYCTAVGNGHGQAGGEAVRERSERARPFGATPGRTAGLSGFVARAMQHELEREQLGAYLEEIDKELGPIPDAAPTQARRAWRGR